MAKQAADPVLQQLIHAVNKSGHAGVPVTICASGTMLTGVLVAEETYFSELLVGSPLMSALQPSSGLLGKEYAKHVAHRSDDYLHLRTTGSSKDELWRISLRAVDGWILRAAGGADSHEHGSFRDLFSTADA